MEYEVKRPLWYPFKGSDQQTNHRTILTCAYIISSIIGIIIMHRNHNLQEKLKNNKKNTKYTGSSKLHGSSTMYFQ